MKMPCKFSGLHWFHRWSIGPGGTTRLKRLRRQGRLAYYRPKADSPDFWCDYWRKENISVRLEEAKKAQSVYFKDLLSLLVRYLPRQGRILDGGCGIGEVVVALRSRGYNIEGVDSNFEVVEAVTNHDPEITVKFGNVLALDYPDGHFDAYVSLGVVEHFEEGPERVLLEARRVLRQGGLLLVSVPFFNPIRKLRTLWSVHKREPQDTFYQYAFTGSQFLDILSRAGFIAKSVHPYNTVAGLSAEVPWLGAFLAWEKVPRKVLCAIQQSRTLRCVAGHMILFLAVKGERS